MSTADILALGAILQSLAWPAAAVTAAWMFRAQLRLAAPPKTPQPDEETLARLLAMAREYPGASEVPLTHARTPSHGEAS